MPAAVKLACYNFSPKKQPDLLILNQKERQPILFLNLCLVLPVWRPHWCNVHRGQMDFWIRVYFMPSTYRSIYAVWWNECVDIWCVDVKRDVVGRDGHDHTRAGWLDGLVALWARDTLWPLPSNTGHTDTDTKIQIQIQMQIQIQIHIEKWPLKCVHIWILKRTVATFGIVAFLECGITLTLSLSFPGSSSNAIHPSSTYNE